MVTISFEVDDVVAFILAGLRSWEPTVEDTTQELVGDEYPRIPNPVSLSQVASDVIQDFLSDWVLQEGRTRVLNEIDSIKAKLDDRLEAGVFDDLIMRGDIDGVKAAMLAALAPATDAG